MPSVAQGGQITFNVQFYEYAGGPSYDPTEAGGHPKFEIFKNSVSAVGPYLYSNGTGAVVRHGVGSYSYTWNVPVAQATGVYSRKWTGTIHGAEVSGEETFEVVTVGAITTSVDEYQEISGSIFSVDQEDKTLKIKFGRTIKTSSISNARFTLTKAAATPITVTNPFKTIDLSRDYNSIARILTLYFNELLSQTTYTVKVSGLIDAAGETIGDIYFTFTTETTGTIPSGLPPEAELVEIEDKSIKTDAYTFDGTIVAANPDFYITEVTPENGEVFLATDYLNGRVTIKFSKNVDNIFLTSAYFKLQKKEIKRGQARWSDITPTISEHSTEPWVYVDIPSTDATPVYNTAGKTYYSTGYKYRIKVSKSVATTDTAATPTTETLGADQYITFVGELDPMYIDIDEITPIFPDALTPEIAELIYIYSLDAKEFLETTEIPHLYREYVKAAVACALSRLYELGKGNELSITLGDLQVSKGGASGKSNLATATSWCELAELLRQKLGGSKAGMRAVVRGDAWRNPIPQRAIRDMESDANWSAHSIRTLIQDDD